jgi:hypothetical protein
MDHRFAAFQQNLPNLAGQVGFIEIIFPWLLITAILVDAARFIDILADPCP